MQNIRKWEEGSQSGMGTVEVTLILVVLVALVLIFKDVIIEFVQNLLSGIAEQGTVFTPGNLAG